MPQLTGPSGVSIDSEVQINASHGTYTTPDGRKYLLENMDIFYEEDNNGNGNHVFTGTWRFAPNSANESTGTFQWKVDDRHFDGSWQMSGDNTKRSWKGDRVDTFNQ